jgi:soluble lytic murein transglycosylase
MQPAGGAYHARRWSAMHFRPGRARRPPFPRRIMADKRVAMPYKPAMRRMPILLLLATLTGTAAVAQTAGQPAPAARAQAPGSPWGADGQRMAGRQALALATQNRIAEAQAMAASADPLTRKTVTWLRLQQRNSGASAQELAGWLLDNPDWPQGNTIAARTEEALATDLDDALALRYFAFFPPRSLDGAQRMADALIRAGRGAEAMPVLRTAWLTAPSDAIAEPAFASRNAGLLTPADHWTRFNRLAFARDLAGAARLLPLLPPERQALAQLRLAYASDRPDAPEALVSGADLGLLAERARWLRRRDRDSEAAAAWQLAAAQQRDLAPETARAIWVERQVLARKLLRLNEPRLAYAVAAQHGQPEAGADRSDAEFLAGFIALRRLNDPARAAAHFAAVGEGSDSIITRARAGYWQGRAAAQAGQRGAAQNFYAQAATLPVAFYGQLAALALGEDSLQLAARINAMPQPAVSPERLAAFADRELVRVVLALADLGDTRLARGFLLRIEALAPDAVDRRMAARLAQQIGRPDNAVWIARRAWADGVVLLDEGWPAPYPPPVEAAEPAFINAITRQESNFDPSAVSGANARGLMQLLPGTAAQVARRLGLPYQLAWLTTDPGFNMKLGAAYLADMLGRFGGNLALAAAGYNAGPGRVNEWLGTYGDPRAGGVEMIDWIEMIPFTETRNYVQRVIENAVIYRARDTLQAGRDHPLQAWLAPAGGQQQAGAAAPAAAAQADAR